MVAFNRTKTCNRVIAAEMSRRYEGKITTVAFDPAYVIDKDDPSLKERWPTGLMGLLWRLLTILLAKPPRVAGEPLADLVLRQDRVSLHGATFRLAERVSKQDRAMADRALGKRLWAALTAMR